MELSQIKHELEEMVPDFAKRAVKIYRVLEWEWRPGRTSPHIPSVGEIENALYSAIERLDEEFLESGSGGVKAFHDPPSEGETGRYGLAFTLEDTRFYGNENPQ
ncbi:unnamed protein product [marine sediment metagenome]|uniref:Uncharacterized protein n=1 Tax=marine sediment metagenome TaxID=412755 RepID=X1F2I4_9ZZZZ